MAHLPDVDAGFLERLRQGDGRAFADLVTAHEVRIRGFLRRLLGPGADVEDAAQVVFTKAYLSLSSFRGEVALESWLYRIARNHAIDRMRRKKARPEDSFSALSEAQQAEVERWGMAGNETPAERLEKSEQARAAWALLGNLSEDDRSVLVLKEAEGKSLEEISRITGASVGAVKVRLFRARRRLKDAAARGGA